MSGEFQKHAEAYAAHGLAVIPVDAASKKPRIGGFGKWRQPLGARAITALSDKHPNAGLGIIPGACVPPLVVIDVDTSDPGEQRAIFARFGGVSPAQVCTPSGGRHGYAHARGGERPAQKPGGIRADIRAGAALVIAPPTFNEAKGRGYVPLDGDVAEFLDLVSGPLPTFDAAALAQLQKHSGTAGVREGGRDAAAFAKVREFAVRCQTRDELLASMRDWNEVTCQPPLAESEIVAKVAWAWCAKQERRLKAPGSGWDRAPIPLAEARPLYGVSAALPLWHYLRSNHGLGHVFAVSPKALAVPLNCSPKAVANARDRLVALAYLKPLHKGGRRRGDASTYSFGAPGIKGA